MKSTKIEHGKTKLEVGTAGASRVSQKNHFEMAIIPPKIQILKMLPRIPTSN